MSFSTGNHGISACKSQWLVLPQSTLMVRETSLCHVVETLHILLCQVGRWLILCAPAVCSWPKGAQKCPAELSNHGVPPESAQKFTAELLLLDPAGSPNLTDCLTAIFALNCAMWGVIWALKMCNWFWWVLDVKCCTKMIPACLQSMPLLPMIGFLF